jgi:hypothetical protein
MSPSQGTDKVPSELHAKQASKLTNTEIHQVTFSTDSKNQTLVKLVEYV